MGSAAIDDDYAPTPYDPVQILQRMDEMLHALRWSWADLARKSGVSERTFHRWRNGETIPQIGGLRGACEAMGLTYEEITRGIRRRDDAPETPAAARTTRAPRTGYDPWKVAMDEAFVGRFTSLRALTDALGQRRSVNVVGDRRIGKSSLLRAFHQRTRSLGHTVVALSGEQISGRDARALVRAITRTDAPEDPDGAADALLAWIRSRRRSGSAPVVIVDEFDDLCVHVDNRFFQRLRGMLGDESVVMVVATRVPVAEIGAAGHTSPFDNLLAVEPVGLLDAAAVDTLLALGPETFSAEDLGLLHGLSGRHPFYLKLLAHHLLRARVEERASGSAVDEFLVDAGGELRKLWQSHLDEAEKEALLGLHRGVPAAAGPARRLRRRGILTEEGAPFAGVLTHWLGDLGRSG